MTKPAMIEDIISISETNPNAGLLLKVLTESKTAHVRETFETAFQVRIETRYVKEDDQIVLPFHTFKGNSDKVKAGFEAILQIMKATNNTFITSHTVRDAAKMVLGGVTPQNDNTKMSNNDKIKAATQSFNKYAPKKQGNSRPSNDRSKNNGGRSSNNKDRGGNNRSRDGRNSNFTAPNPIEAMQALRSLFKYKFDPKSQTQADLYKIIDDKKMTFAIGPAGTGKTHIAIAKSVQALVDGDVKKIILSRPNVQNGPDVGILPGGIREKLGEYLMPLFDELETVVGDRNVVEELIAAGIVEIAPMGMVRGRTLKNAYVILDEAQNATESQMRMFLTRYGKPSKMIITGDPTQIDLPSNIQSGLMGAHDLTKDISDIGHISFKNKDIFRDELVGKLLEAFDAVGFGIQKHDNAPVQGNKNPKNNFGPGNN